jgi:hypothetical protein
VVVRPTAHTHVVTEHKGVYGHKAKGVKE